jgi:transaldolase
MQLFLDSADVEDIRTWLNQGVLDGVTTNPSVLRRDGVDSPFSAIARLGQLVAPGELHAEVTAPDGDALISEAMELAALRENLVIKVPVLTPEGKPLLAEISRLAAAEVRVNCTVCMSLPHVMLAAKAGAAYASLLIGRIDDEGGDGAKVLREARVWLDDWGYPTKLIAASIRGAQDVRRSMVAGAHCITAGGPVLSQIVNHHYARATVRQFLEDARVKSVQ